MKVFGIIGSPRKEGNTDTLVSKVMEGVEQKSKNPKIQKEKLYLADFNLQPCRVCLNCKETGICIIEDDFQFILQKIKDSDFIIFGSPVYCQTITALSKTLIERVNSSQTFMTKEGGKKKFKSRAKTSPRRGGVRKGVIICIGDLSSLNTITEASKVMGWLFTDLGIELADKILARSLSAKGDALRNRALLQRAFNAGLKLNRLV